MSHWLDPVRYALDSLPDPVPLFFRDDDGGWSDDRLFRLLDLFAGYDLPVDLAVIPRALTQALAQKLCERIEANRELIAVHQHGFAHANHELEGRKCEFGPSRSRLLQQQDIESGKRLLADLFGPIAQPIFTPPWNRSTALTGQCLIDLGFRILSRDRSAEPLNISALSELPVRVDWFAKRKGFRLNQNQMGQLIADAVRDSEPVGIMFHHALMDACERDSASELLALLAAHDKAQCRLMQSFVEAQSKQGAVVEAHTSVLV